MFLYVLAVCTKAEFTVFAMYGFTGIPVKLFLLLVKRAEKVFVSLPSLITYL